MMGLGMGSVQNEGCRPPIKKELIPCIPPNNKPPLLYTWLKISRTSGAAFNSWGGGLYIFGGQTHDFLGKKIKAISIFRRRSTPIFSHKNASSCIHLRGFS